jgi:hypothetical protein
VSVGVTAVGAADTESAPNEPSSQGRSGTGSFGAWSRLEGAEAPTSGPTGVDPTTACQAEVESGTTATDEISIATMIGEAAGIVVHCEGADPGAAAFVVTTGACNRSGDNGICIWYCYSLAARCVGQEWKMLME